MLYLNFSPTEDQISELESWLKYEDSTVGEGFYCNWNVITRSIARKNFAALCSQNGVVGFLTWHQGDVTAELSIAEIHPMHRKKGLGRIMLKLFEEYLSSQNVVGITLMCQPAESEVAWLKMQFIRMPTDFEENEVKMYKIIVAHQPSIQYVEDCTSDQILVWNAEPIRVDVQRPLYCWEPSFAEGGSRLATPIIFPCKPDWSVAWKRDGQLEKPVKIKYFNRRDDISHGDFGIITVLG